MTNIVVDERMESEDQDQDRDASLRQVFEIPGEPAIVINGVPDVYPTDNALGAPRDADTVPLSNGNKGFGEWLEGREVRKLFGEEYYTGVVTEFDREAGWYRVVYEDGDSEDLDWVELEVVLQPLDIMVPLKTLALKTLRRSNKALQSVAKFQARAAKSVASKGKGTSADEVGLLMEPDNRASRNENDAEFSDG